MSFGKCSICDSQVLYNEDAVLAKCSICGKEESTYILCEESHYVCADCCAKEGGISGHTPHTIATVSFLMAVKNLTGKLTDEDVQEGLKRSYEIPPGWCGYFGACGAGIGIGVAFSIVLGATPSSDKERSVANYATACCLKK